MCEKASTPKAKENWTSNVLEENLIYEDEEFVVWLDKNLDVWWEARGETEKRIKELRKGKEWATFVAKQTELEALPTSHLSEESKKGFRCQIGAALFLLISENNRYAIDTLEVAKRFYFARTSERARMWILQFSIACLTVVTVVLGVTGWIGAAFSSLLLNGFEQVILGGYAGMWGSFVSLFRRASILGVDATAGRPLHFLETGCRSLAGFVAGSLCVCAIVAGILFPKVLEFGPVMIAVLGFVAGFSERFIPSIVDNVQFAADNEKNERSGV